MTARGKRGLRDNRRVEQEGRDLYCVAEFSVFAKCKVQSGGSVSAQDMIISQDGWHVNSAVTYTVQQYLN